MDEAIGQIKLRCVFCNSEYFALPYKGFEPFHGGFIVCANCGRENDYTSLMLVAQEQALALAKDYTQNMLTQQLQKAFKGHCKLNL